MEQFEALSLTIDSLADTMIKEEINFVRSTKMTPELEKQLDELNKGNSFNYTAKDIIARAKLEDC